MLSKYGLIPTMINGGTSIADGFNRKENHLAIEERFRESVKNAIEYNRPASSFSPAIARACRMKKGWRTVSSA